MPNLTGPSPQLAFDIDPLTNKLNTLQRLLGDKKKQWETAQKEADHFKTVAGQAYDAWMKVSDEFAFTEREIYLREHPIVDN